MPKAKPQKHKNTNALWGQTVRHLIVRFFLRGGPSIDDFFQKNLSDKLNNFSSSLPTELRGHIGLNRRCMYSQFVRFKEITMLSSINCAR